MGTRINVFIGGLENPGAVLYSNSHHPDVDAEEIVRQAAAKSSDLSQLTSWLLRESYRSDHVGHKCGDPVFTIDLEPFDHEKVVIVHPDMAVETRPSAEEEVPAKEASEFIKDLLAFIAKHDLHGEFLWHADLKFFVNCNDFFFWGCADGEPVTPESFAALKKAVEDAGEAWGPQLYCARQRAMRPQGAFYESIDRELWPLFDACGPERETGFGNPKPRPE